MRSPAQQPRLTDCHSRKPFAAGSPRDSRRLTDAPAWRILAKTHFTLVDTFSRTDRRGIATRLLAGMSGRETIVRPPMFTGLSAHSCIDRRRLRKSPGFRRADERYGPTQRGPQARRRFNVPIQSDA